MKNQLFKFLKRLSLFLICTMVLYVIFLILFAELAPSFLKGNLIKNFHYGFLEERLSEVKKFSDVDILILGSSRAYRHYDTRFFKENGYKTFNLGSSAQTMVQTEILLKRYLEKLNPEIILFDIWPEMLNSDGVESSLDLISNDYNDIQTLKLALKQMNVKVINTLIYNYYLELTGNKLRGNLEKISEDNYITGGYVRKKLKFSRTYEGGTLAFNMRQNQKEAFLRLLNELNQEDIRVIFIQSPMHKNIDFQGYKIRPLIRKKNYRYLDFTRNFMLDDSLDFYNPFHMNENGVKKFDKALLDSLN